MECELIIYIGIALPDYHYVTYSTLCTEVVKDEKHAVQVFKSFKENNPDIPAHLFRAQFKANFYLDEN